MSDCLQPLECLGYYLCRRLVLRRVLCVPCTYMGPLPGQPADARLNEWAHIVSTHHEWSADEKIQSILEWQNDIDMQESRGRRQVNWAVAPLATTSALPIRGLGMT